MFDIVAMLAVIVIFSTIVLVKAFSGFSKSWEEIKSL